MIITTKEFKKDKVPIIWPTLSLGRQWFDQRQYYVPTIKETKNRVVMNSVAGLPYNKDFLQCESYALLLWGNIKRSLIDEALQETAKHSLDLPDYLNNTWLFGFARGMNFSMGNAPEGVPHALNFVYTTTGFWLIEPQKNRFWKPEKSNKKTDKDFVYYITA